MSTSGWINSYQLPPGRRLYALRATLKVAEEIGSQAVVAACHQAIAHDDATWSLLERYNREKRSPADPALAALDSRLDKTIGAIATTLRATADVGPTAESQEAAARILSAFFLSGATEYTALAFEEQVVAVDKLLKHLEAGGEHHTDAAAAGVSAWVTSARQIHANFADVLARQTRDVVTADQMRAANAQGMEGVAHVVATIISSHWGADGTTARERLLAPLATQNERLAARYGGRRGLQDVNPETGDELSTEVPAEMMPSPTPATPPAT